MQKSYRIRTIIALILALLCAFMIFNYLEKLQQKEAIIVAVQDIEPYTKLSGEMLSKIYVSKQDREKLFQNAVQNPEEVIGAITRVKIEANQPIVKAPEKLVYGEEVTNALNFQREVDKAFFIPYDKRLMAIEVDASGSMSFKLRRGDFVDVIFTSIDDTTGGLYSSMILQHVQIFDIEEIAADNQSSGMVGKKQNIQLLLTPEECMKLAVAKRNGVLDLALNPLEGETNSVSPIHLLDLAAYKPVPKSQMLEIFEEQIKAEDLSEEVKNEMLKAIEKEKSIETLKNTVDGSRLSEEDKKKIYDILNKAEGK
ncbi:MAG: Flp pilus assembly protein CpaB [Bacillota bacterium]